MTTEYKTYPAARFHICDGFYTLEEIEDFVVQFRAAKQLQDKALVKTMENFRKLHHPLCNMFVPGNPSYGANDCKMCDGLEKEFSNCKSTDEMIEQVRRYNK